MRSMRFLISMSGGNLLPKSVIATNGVLLQNMGQSSLSGLKNFHGTKLIYHRRHHRPAQWFVLQQTQQNQAPNQIIPNAMLFLDAELIYNLSMVLFQLLQTVGEKFYVGSPYWNVAMIEGLQIKHSLESKGGQTMTKLPQIYCFTIFHS